MLFRSRSFVANWGKGKRIVLVMSYQLLVMSYELLVFTGLMQKLILPNPALIPLYS